MLIYSAFGWCINLNFDKFTCMTGFVVQDHILSIWTYFSNTWQIVSSDICRFCYHILVLFKIFLSYFDLNRCLLIFCDIKRVHFDHRSVCCPAMSCSTMWTPRSWKCWPGRMNGLILWWKHSASLCSTSLIFWRCNSSNGAETTSTSPASLPGSQCTGRAHIAGPDTCRYTRNAWLSLKKTCFVMWSKSPLIEYNITAQGRDGRHSALQLHH